MENTKMTPQRAQKILKEHGTNLTLEEAEKVIEFMQMLAKIAVAQYLRKEEPVNKEYPKSPGNNKSMDSNIILEVLEPPNP